jgi:hypothetical protein
LHHEVAAIRRHKESQEGHVELNIGGYRFQTSVQTLRRVPHTFFDAYFSGRYAQDVCDDGSIFVDRDGEHFRHVFEYMRDGVVSVAEPGAHPSVSLLRALKREFGFYCIELLTEQAAEQPEVAYVMGGSAACGGVLSSMERYDPSMEQWSSVAAMHIGRYDFGTCVPEGELHVTGGRDDNSNHFSSVEKCSPSSNTWIAMVPLPGTRAGRAAVAVGSAMYVLGGKFDDNDAGTASVLKFDSTQGIWSQVAPMPASRPFFAACAVGNDIFVFGGEHVEEDHASVFKYNTVTNTWSTLPPMPDSCSFISASVMDGLIYIVGAKRSTREYCDLTRHRVFGALSPPH